MRSGPKLDVQGERKNKRRKKGKEEKASKKPEAQMRGNRQNMQSGINGYSRRLIEGLASFGRKEEFLVQFFDKQQQPIAWPRGTRGENMCLWLNKRINYLSAAAVKQIAPMCTYRDN